MMQQNSFSGVRNLPAPLRSFVGRDSEIGALRQLLNEPACRLLTLVGPGGIGKTRLASEAAHLLVDRFPDGVVWIDLQAGETEEFLCTTMADALALSLSGPDAPRRQLVRALQDKALLLVLDNVEQLIDHADLLSEIVAYGAATKLLVTSRVALQLQEEWLFPVSGLAYPADEDATPAGDELEAWDAVRLFVERARRVRPDFSPRAEQDHLRRICRLTEGMPLALEMAAAWVRSLDCATIASEIERNLSFLTSTMRNVPPRHRSMRAVFEHSWTLLDVDARAVFQRLSLFRGGFRREAAQKIAGASLAQLTSLVDHSLLRWEANGRYAMHELLRQFAVERLAQCSPEMGRTRACHARYYIEFLLQRSDALHGAGQRRAADEIGAELENFRAAWQWVVQEKRVEQIGQAIEPLAMFFQLKSRYLEATRMAQAALQALDEAEECPEASIQQARARVLSEVGWFSIRLGQFDRAMEAFRECQALYTQLDLLPLPGSGTDPRLGLSILAMIGGDSARAEELTLAASQTARAQNHLHNLQACEYQLANIAYGQGKYEQAHTHAQAAYAISQQAGDRWFMAYCLSELGRSAWALGDHAAAQRHFEESFGLREELSDWEGMALALNNLGHLALHDQRVEEAERLYEQSQALYRQTSDQGGLAAAQLGVGKATLAQHAFDRARHHLRAALATAAAIQFTPLALSILAACGHFLLQTGRLEPGLGLLIFVREHAATDQETKRTVQQQVQHLRATVSPALLAAPISLPDLETAVASAQAALRAEIPSRAEEVPRPPAPPAALVEPLTAREQEVLHLLAQGLTNREIAERLTVVIGTVKAHNNRIFGKLGVRNRVQALARARELQLL